MENFIFRVQFYADCTVNRIRNFQNTDQQPKPSKVSWPQNAHILILFISLFNASLVLFVTFISILFSLLFSPLENKYERRDIKSVYCNYLLTKVTQSITSLCGKMLLNGRIHREGISADSYFPKFDKQILVQRREG